VPGKAPWLETYPEPVNGLIQKLEAAEQANRLEAWLWLDGPTSKEGQVEGEARELFLEMNGLALASEDPGELIRAEPAWERLGPDRRTDPGAVR
jgi:hypothetical protein